MIPISFISFQELMSYFPQIYINRFMKPNYHNSHQLVQTQHLIHQNAERSDVQCSSQLQLQSNPQPLPEQIQLTLITLKKLKKIGKNNKLTQLKVRQKKINQIFKRMNQLFNRKFKRTRLNQQQRKKLQQKRKSSLRGAGIRRRQELLRMKPELLRMKPQMVVQGLESQVLSQKRIQIDQFLNSSKEQIKKLKCYCCKQNYEDIHNFYDCLCIKCGDFNFKKRNQTADFHGKVALVTGARIKIGYQIALKLLRDGAIVIVTSRFFKDAFLRYYNQHDYKQWSKSLYLIQCDFTSSSQVQHLVETIKSKFTHLDILINNAAQTIVRPKQFYLTQILNQQKQIQYIPDHILDLYNKQIKSDSLFSQYPSLFLPQQSPSNPKLSVQNQTNDSSLQHKQIITVQNQTNDSSLQHKQIIFNSQNAKIDHATRDQFNQPCDKRQKNSWIQKLQDVTLVDCYTTQLVNSIVPFYLISQLKAMMKKPNESKQKSFIINVSSMQGVFYRSYKKYTHPHTNMAKAALNMITRTSAQQFILDKIYMNSVDTGWVTQQNPQNYKYTKQRKIPLDCVDGAMRVLDPIYLAIREQIFIHGKFIKDYKQSNW